MRSLAAWRRMSDRTITDARVRQIRGLLATGGLSCAKIARQVGVSPATAVRIANGTFRKPRPRPKRKSKLRPPAPKKEPLPASGEVEYCEPCGVSVKMPCLVCHLRRHAGQRVYFNREVPLVMDLRGEAYGRYREIVRAHRILSAIPRPTDQQRAEARRQACQAVPEEVVELVEQGIHPCGGEATSGPGNLPVYHADLNARPRHGNFRPRNDS